MICLITLIFNTNSHWKNNIENLFKYENEIFKLNASYEMITNLATRTDYKEILKQKNEIMKKISILLNTKITSIKELEELFGFLNSDHKNILKSSKKKDLIYFLKFIIIIFLILKMVRLCLWACKTLVNFFNRSSNNEKSIMIYIFLFMVTVGAHFFNLSIKNYVGIVCSLKFV